MVEARPRDEIDKLYKTKRWKELRLVILNRDKYRCQECKRRNTYSRATIVHHLIEAREDLSLFWTPSNLESICPGCHNREHPERSGGTKQPKRNRNVVKFYANNER